MREVAAREGGWRLVEVTDEREPLAERALGVILVSIPEEDRHPTYMLRNQLRDTRLGQVAPDDYHMLAVLEPGGEPVAVASGRYLADANVGFVMYLAVRPEHRGGSLGSWVREALVDTFREDARQNGEDDLAAVVGEIAFDSPWLLSLVRAGVAIPLDLDYYHPGMAPSWSDERYVLYRQPIVDRRATFSADEVRAMLDAVWKRGYRFRYPPAHEGFKAMLAQLEGREVVGPHPEIVRLAAEE